MLTFFVTLSSQTRRPLPTCWTGARGPHRGCGGILGGGVPGSPHVILIESRKAPYFVPGLPHVVARSGEGMGLRGSQRTHAAALVPPSPPGGKNTHDSLCDAHKDADVLDTFDSNSREENSVKKTARRKFARSHTRNSKSPPPSRACPVLPSFLQGSQRGLRHVVGRGPAAVVPHGPRPAVCGAYS